LVSIGAFEPRCGREEVFGKGADIGLILLIFVVPLLFGVQVTMAALTMVAGSAVFGGGG
jgi:hypothetical protein